MLCATSAHIENSTSPSRFAANENFNQDLAIVGVGKKVAEFLAHQTVSLTNNLGLNFVLQNSADTLQTVAKSTACTASVRLSHNVEQMTSKPSRMQVMPFLA